MIYHWGCSEAENDGCWNQGVESRVELGGDVRRIAKLTNDDGPFAFEHFDQPSGNEHARENQSSVNGGQRARSKTRLAVNRTLFHM